MSVSVYSSACVCVVYDSFPFQLATSFMCLPLLLGLAQRSQAHSSQRQLGGVAKLSASSSSLFFLLPSLFSRSRPPYNTHTHAFHTRSSSTDWQAELRENHNGTQAGNDTHTKRRSLSQLLLSLSILLLLAPHSAPSWN